jgi:hypothetical protein
LVTEHQIYPQAIRWFCDDQLRVNDGIVTLTSSKAATNGHFISPALG